jgi:hypothetical protein
MWNTILKTLGRTTGNAVPIMAQKSLVGHAKGGAAAWQMAGLLQSVASGTVPGNRNADNVDALFQQHSLLMFPSKTIQTDGITAGVMVRSPAHRIRYMFNFLSVIIRVRTSWWNRSCCPSTLRACCHTALYLRILQSSTQGALSQVVQGHVRDDDDQRVGENQGGPPVHS